MERPESPEFAAPLLSAHDQQMQIAVSYSFARLVNPTILLNNELELFIANNLQAFARAMLDRATYYHTLWSDTHTVVLMDSLQLEPTEESFDWVVEQLASRQHFSVDHPVHELLVEGELPENIDPLLDGEIDQFLEDYNLFLDIPYEVFEM